MRSHPHKEQNAVVQLIHAFVLKKHLLLLLSLFHGIISEECDVESINFTISMLNKVEASVVILFGSF